MLEMHVTSKCVPAKSEVASDTFAETCDSMAGMTWASHHYLVAATNYWTKLVAATNTFPENCDLMARMSNGFLAPSQIFERIWSPRPIHPARSVIYSRP